MTMAHYFSTGLQKPLYESKAAFLFMLCSLYEYTGTGDMPNMA